MSIILLVIDTLRYDYVGANGNDRVRTPNLDRLAARSWCFDCAFTSSYPTIPNRRDIITGKYGGPFHPWQPLPHGDVTFPWLLAEAGYATQLMHDTPHLVSGGHNFDWPFHAWRFIRGAEVDRPWIRSLKRHPENWTRDPLFDFVTDEQFEKSNFMTYAFANCDRRKPEEWNCDKLFQAGSEFLRDNANRRNFFLWIDCFDPHEPWDAPAEFLRMYDQTPGYDGRIDPRSFIGRNDPRLSEAGRERVKAAYAAKVSWMDRCLGGFLDELEETGLDKTTAVILTADHGTNVGERGSFGKGHPVRQGEGHVPLFISVPGGARGHSDIIAQPQDLFATILGLAAVPKPRGVDSHDLISQALQETRGSRDVAIAGRAANGWKGQADEVLFSVFDREWCLEWTPEPEHSRLTHHGALANVADAHPSVVERLHSEGLEELARRGTDPRLVAWLRERGHGEFPRDAVFFEGYPGPAGFTPYFNRLYKEPSTLTRPAAGDAAPSLGRY